MSIQVLDQSTINKIAAGEVIERPASVVKELLENAIDAKSTAVTIEIKDGGTSLIRITDNGCGIPSGEVATAFLRHATSKIKSVEDLMCVSSLGFRGEALSSIAAVCQVELITKTPGDMTGTRYVIEGGKEILREHIGAPEGTTFIVRNIFYNTPARRKFLKSNVTEAGYVSDIVERIALSHSDVSIRFINNNQNKIHTPGNNNLKDIIYNVYGRDITSNLIEVNETNDFMSIYGYVGKPVISRGNRNYENYYINGRYVKSSIISRAIEEAYKSFMMQHKYPFTTLHFHINQDLLDVNVHPTKMDLRLKNAEEVFPFIKNAIFDVLSHKEFISSVEVPEPKIVDSIPEVTSESSVTPNIPSVNQKAAELINREHSFVKANTPPLTSYSSSYTSTPVLHDEPKSAIVREERVPEPFEVVREQKVKSEISKNITSEEKQISLFTDNKKENSSDGAAPLLSPVAVKNHKIVGQVFDTYWIVEYLNDMFIIDQHAAHEKVLYERLMKRILNETPDTQLLSPPIIISLSINEERLLKIHLDDFKKLGFEIESFGGMEYAVRGVPTGLPGINKKDLLIEMIDGLSDENLNVSSELVLEKLASMSCKAAVKGNNRLSFPEAQTLIDELMTLDNPYNCPHGRPVIISMSKYELEKKFKRIV